MVKKRSKTVLKRNGQKLSITVKNGQKCSKTVKTIKNDQNNQYLSKKWAIWSKT